MTVRVLFNQLSIRNLRNLTTVDFEPSPRLNVIAGDNGQGKTSLLEALYLAATSRSFRTDRVRDLIQDGQEAASVRAVISDGTQEREQRVVVGQASRRLTLDGKPANRAAAYATRSPVVVFHPGDLVLVSGAAAGRRILLDRVALFLEPGSGEHRRRYIKAMRERQRALEERGPAAKELDAYEPVMAEYGALLTRAHARAADEVVLALATSFSRLAGEGTALEAHYASAGTECSETFAAELRQRRETDRRRRSASFGPHRDDLALSIGGRPARHQASQGQQRILTLALKLAELQCVRASRNAHPVLLLDDVSSELDPERTGAVYELVRTTRSQVFVTTTRPELLTTPELGPGERTDWVVSCGQFGPVRYSSN